MGEAIDFVASRCFQFAEQRTNSGQHRNDREGKVHIGLFSWKSGLYVFEFCESRDRGSEDLQSEIGSGTIAKRDSLEVEPWWNAAILDMDCSFELEQHVFPRRIILLFLDSTGAKGIHRLRNHLT